MANGQQAEDAVTSAWKAVNGLGAPPEERKLLLEHSLAAAQGGIERKDQSRSRWTTPLAIALTGLITLVANFGVDYLKADRAADIAALSSQREFQYRLIERELAGKTTEVERAKVLLFLVKIGVLRDLNEAEIERIALSKLPPGSTVTIPPLSSSDVRRLLNEQGSGDVALMISDKAIDTIVSHEALPPDLYEKMSKSRPYILMDDLGMQIGFTYSLYRTTAARLRTDWGDILDEATLDALEPAIGLRGEAAKSFVEKFPADLRVPFEAAKAFFVRDTLDSKARDMLAVLPNAARLTPDCFGAVLDLSIFRGVNFSSTSPRGANMNAVKQAIDNQQFDRLPALIRAMKQGPGMAIGAKRFEEEAKLCETAP